MRVWRVPSKPALNLWTQPKKKVIWGHKTFLRIQVTSTVTIKMTLNMNLLVELSKNMYITLLAEKIRIEEGDKRESAPSVKRPSPGCVEAENTVLTKRPRTHQQNENQQVSS